MTQSAKPQDNQKPVPLQADDLDPEAQLDTPPALTLSAVVNAARWLAGSTYRLHPLQLVGIAIAQVVGAVGTALGTIAVFFYIRAAVGDGTLGQLNIQIESAGEPATAVLFLVSVVVIIIVAAGSLWLSEKAIAGLARDHAERLRSMILELLADPLSKDWQDAVGYRRPTIELQQTLIARVRSMTVALTNLLALGPAIVVLALSLIVMFIIDPVAALLLLPFTVLFALIGERVNRRVQSLTAQYEGRQERSREVLAYHLDDFFTGHTSRKELSLARASSDDGLFHDRLLASAALRFLNIITSALLFALTAGFFIIVRGVENLSLEIIIVYIFAIRFATQSAQQINKALAQVSRRYEDIEAVNRFVATIDEYRAKQDSLLAHHGMPKQLHIGDSSDMGVTVEKHDVALVLSAEPVTEDSAAATLRMLIASSHVPGLDLTDQVRVFSPSDGNGSIDVLGSAQIRVIISDDPIEPVPPKLNTFTFVIHHRPKLLLASTVQEASDRLGPAFVVRNGEIVWAGSVKAAGASSEKIRKLAKRQRRSKSRTKAPTIAESTKS